MVDPYENLWFDGWFTFSSLDVPFLGSPFEVQAGGAKGNVMAKGPGLQSAFTGRPTRFEVDTKAFPGQVMETKIYSKHILLPFFHLTN